LSVEEVVRQELAEIEDYASFNAFVTTFDLDAEIISKNLIRARSAFDKKRSGRISREPSLLGIPFTVKDNVFVAGYRTTAGCVAFKDFVPNVNGDVFDLFYTQGAIPLGKTNLHELALGPTCSSSYFGPVRNAADFTRVAGGSSGGSAVSVAKAKYAIATIGSDTGGSVRIPAALCGVCGFKPTFGTISSFGVFPLSSTLDTVGVLARTVDDVEFILTALLPLKFGRGSAKKREIRRKQRVGIPGRRYFESADKSVLKAFWNAIDKIRAEFEIVEGISIPDEEKVPRVRRSIMLREGAWFYSEILSNKEYRAKMDPDVLTPLDAGGKMGVIEAMQAESFRQGYTSKMFGIFEDVDFVATPTCLIEAPKQEDMMDRSEYARKRPLLIRNPEVWNLCGFPALTLPSNRLDGRAPPTGFQMAGKYGSDRELLDAGVSVWNLVHG
jgi:aspartyl-tRNA(Asn)/glutamyl-tRNA(Gln) amidotransferase subunit A